MISENMIASKDSPWPNRRDIAIVRCTPVVVAACRKIKW
uniref:Uncharacterized protein n=1 Tax=Rhizophora mucronata TaxID=61149 RepID=A0A2P2LY30_RHIMU